MKRRYPHRNKKWMRISDAKLDRLVEEATVDAYTKSEQIVGFYTILEDNLAVPFVTEILGAEVIVEKIDLTGDERILQYAREGIHSNGFLSPICPFPIRRRGVRNVP